MRLVCPNCDAQYEVDDGAIPEAGRDVQCSNCGHAWFQMPADPDAEDLAFEPALRPPLPQQGSAPPPPTIAPAQAADPATKGRAVDPDATGPVANADRVADTPAPAIIPANDKPAGAKPGSSDISKTPPPSSAAPPFAPNKAETVSPPAQHPQAASAADGPQGARPVAPRRGLDESLMAVLREEAEREAAVRRSETPRAFESQTELGLEETAGAASAAKAARDRLARLRGPEPAPEPTDKPTARRDLLPDIEEINSTLRASTEQRSGDDYVRAHPASADESASNTGFRSGFSLVMLIAVVLIATYLAAPRIAEQLPATKDALEGYVAAVDAARVWLDAAMGKAITALQGLAGGDNG